MALQRHRQDSVAAWKNNSPLKTPCIKSGNAKSISHPRKLQFGTLVICRISGRWTMADNAFKGYATSNTMRTFGSKLLPISSKCGSTRSCHESQVCQLHYNSWWCRGMSPYAKKWQLDQTSSEISKIPENLWQNNWGTHHNLKLGQFRQASDEARRRECPTLKAMKRVQQERQRRYQLIETTTLQMEHTSCRAPPNVLHVVWPTGLLPSD